MDHIDPQGRVASHRVGYGDNSFEEIVAEIKHVLIEEIERQKAATAG